MTKEIRREMPTPSNATDRATASNNVPTSNLSTDQEALRASHTPGPWTFNIRQAKADCCGAVTSSIGYVKADTGHIEIAVLYRHAHQEANARLIAAAPDLLEALKKLQVAVVRYGVQDHDSDDFQPFHDVMSCMKLADAVIAKADVVLP